MRKICQTGPPLIRGDEYVRDRIGRIELKQARGEHWEAPINYKMGQYSQCCILNLRRGIQKAQLYPASTKGLSDRCNVQSAGLTASSGGECSVRSRPLRDSMLVSSLAILALVIMAVRTLRAISWTYTSADSSNLEWMPIKLGTPREFGGRQTMDFQP
jgi:hypothetical protein